MVGEANASAMEIMTGGSSWPWKSSKPSSELESCFLAGVAKASAMETIGSVEGDSAVRFFLAGVPKASSIENKGSLTAVYVFFATLATPLKSPKSSNPSSF